MNKLYRNTVLKRRPTTSNDFGGEVTKAASMILNLFEKKGGNKGRAQEEEPDDNFSYQRSVSKDEEKNSPGKKAETNEFDKTGASFQKRNLKISIPTANSNKYIKDLMFPDSKGSQMKEEHYASSPQFGGGYGTQNFKQTKCKSSIKRTARTYTRRFCPAKGRCSFSTLPTSLVIGCKGSKCRRPVKTWLET
jgi:hypothetical protein